MEWHFTMLYIVLYGYIDNKALLNLEALYHSTVKRSFLIGHMVLIDAL